GRPTGVEALVGGDPIQPGAQRRAFLESCEALPSGQQGVLEGVFGVLEGSENPVAVHLQLSPVRLGELTPARNASPSPARARDIKSSRSTLTTSFPPTPSTPVQPPAQPELGGRQPPSSPDSRRLYQS